MKGVVGYRTWELDYRHELLKPTIAYHAPPWNRSGPTRAVCATYPRWGIRNHAGDAPSEDCECGLYAHPDFESITYDPAAFSTYRYVAGAVISWGTLTSHGNGLGLEGFRAQWSRPI